MITRAVAVVDKGAVLREASSGPPLTLRRVHSDEPDVCTICLVGSAAGPLAGDDVRLELTVGDGARARVEASGACLAQGRPGGAPARLTSTASVGDGAELIAEPPPLIVARGSAVAVAVILQLAETASLCWRELVVLGRTGEQAGSLMLDWDVTRAGRPLLRQTVDLTDERLLGWHGMLGEARVMATGFLTRPGLAARTIVASHTAVAQRIDDVTVLATVLDSDAASARGRLDVLLETL